jgi:hypothetical protein
VLVSTPSSNQSGFARNIARACCSSHRVGVSTTNVGFATTNQASVIVTPVQRSNSANAAAEDVLRKAGRALISRLLDVKQRIEARDNTAVVNSKQRHDGVDIPEEGDRVTAVRKLQ